LGLQNLKLINMALRSRWCWLARTACYHPSSELDVVYHVKPKILLELTFWSIKWWNEVTALTFRCSSNGHVNHHGQQLGKITILSRHIFEMQQRGDTVRLKGRNLQCYGACTDRLDDQWCRTWEEARSVESLNVSCGLRRALWAGARRNGPCKRNLESTFPPLLFLSHASPHIYYYIGVGRSSSNAFGERESP
jgi:hypothetical protein